MTTPCRVHRQCRRAGADFARGADGGVSGHLRASPDARPGEHNRERANSAAQSQMKIEIYDWSTRRGRTRAGTVGKVPEFLAAPTTCSAAERARPCSVHECRPRGGREDVRPERRRLGVADGDRAIGEALPLDAVVLVSAAVAGLGPGALIQSVLLHDVQPCPSVSPAPAPSAGSGRCSGATIGRWTAGDQSFGRTAQRAPFPPRTVLPSCDPRRPHPNSRGRGTT